MLTLSVFPCLFWAFLAIFTSQCAFFCSIALETKGLGEFTFSMATGEHRESDWGAFELREKIYNGYRLAPRDGHVWNANKFAAYFAKSSIFPLSDNSY